MNARFLTESEVAERTQISLATLRRWRLENRGPKYRKFGSLVRYPEDELASWEQNQPGGGDATDPAKQQIGRGLASRLPARRPGSTPRVLRLPRQPRGRREALLRTRQPNFAMPAKQIERRHHCRVSWPQ